MVSAEVVEMMHEAAERAAEICSATYRKKDISVRTCQKCGSHFQAGISLENNDGVFSDANMAWYCLGCYNIVASGEIGVE